MKDWAGLYCMLSVMFALLCVEGSIIINIISVANAVLAAYLYNRAERRDNEESTENE